MTRHLWLFAAAALLGLAAPADARRKPQPPSPLPTDTLVENVNGYTLDKAGALIRFNGLLIDDKGRVKQLLKRGDERKPVKFRTDARGRTLLPGLIDVHGHVMALGLPSRQQEAARFRNNPVAREAALIRAQQLLASAGVTTIGDAGTSLDDWLLYRRFGDEGRLTIRIHAMADGMGVLEQVGPLRPTPWLYDDRLIMRSVVLSADPPQGATPAAADARIRNLVSKASMIGAQTTLAAHGAAASAQALDVYAEMLPTYGRDRRYRIAYVHAAPEADVQRLADMGLVVAMPPAAAPPALLTNDTRLAFGSNGTAGAPDLFAALQAAVTRPDRALTMERALAAFTSTAAYAAFAEDRLGTLEPGKWADFILVDRDIFAVPPADISATQVIETWVGGRRAFVKGP